MCAKIRVFLRAFFEGFISRYQGLPRNIHRHVIISEHKEALGHLPSELKEANVVVSVQTLNIREKLLAFHGLSAGI